MNKKRKKKTKNRTTQYIPNTKKSRIQRAKGFYKPDVNDPTIDISSETRPSDEINYELPDDEYNYDRPSEKFFSFEGFMKPILITVIASIIIAIGAWIFSHHMKIALIEQENVNQNLSIKKNESDLEELGSQVEEIETQQKIENYRIDQLEKNNEK